ncbi:MAG: response regulator [Anaerolineae bacterium]|nr:response regulator [Anaerolineae bacterium]
MEASEEFEEYLQEALIHLYDPAYQPPELLWRLMGYTQPPSAGSMRRAIVQAIEKLKPAPDVPPTARIRRIYDLLHYRYVQELTQKETALRLGITPRHLRRQQRQAVHFLARWIWEQSRGVSLVADHVGDEFLPVETNEEGSQLTAWSDQLQQELISLQRSAPGTIADVGRAIQEVIALGDSLILKRSVKLHMASVQSGLTVKAHPSVLHQILITAVETLARSMSSGQIVLGARLEAGCVKVTIAGNPVAATPPENEFIRKVLMTLGGSVEIDVRGKQVAFELTFLPSSKATVLVVDDNTDLVHFYQRYVQSTRYEIIHVREGRKVFETVASSPPDAIVLDVMLPDVDGWKLLADLHKHDLTKSTPIIVCSVVRQERLALALGAALYLSKPVRRQEFIRALDRVLD